MPVPSPFRKKYFTLICISRFNDRIHHYKLYYDGTHYIKDKRYDCIYDLVADGLIFCHMELKAHHILEMINCRTNYTESPYVTLNRRKLNTLSKMQQWVKHMMINRELLMLYTYTVKLKN